MIAPLGSILIVDDDAVVRRRLGDLLTRKGYAVETAVTCQEGIDRITQTAPVAPYRVAIIDIRLPDGLGLEVLKTAKRLMPETTCLMISNSPDEAVDEDVRAAGANGYLLKPLLADQLIDAMQRGGFLG